MADFDPDAYLASKTGPAPPPPAPTDAFTPVSSGGGITISIPHGKSSNFDPDAYLASKKDKDEDKRGGILPNFAAGFGEGVTGGLDTLDKAVNPYRRVAEAVNDFGPKWAPKLPVADQALYNHLLGYLGLNPDDVAARTLPEKLSRWAGIGATAALVPEGGATTLGAKVAQAGARALTGAVSGVAGGGAQEALPEGTPGWIKAPVALFASMAAGIPMSAAVSALANVPGQVARTTELARAGSSPAIAEQAAGKVLAQNATDVKTVKEMLAQPTQRVPGSEPTTFQATGDLGLGSLERATATKNPELFAARRAEQNAARLSALNGIQEGANPVAVADYVRSQLHALDTRTAGSIAQSIGEGQVRVAALGGEPAPEVLGQTIRDAVSTAEGRTRQAERGLWNAVDPNGDLTGNMEATADAAKTITGRMRSTEKPMAGEEKAVFDEAAQLPKVSPVADLIALRSRVSTAMRDELTTSGRTPTYARLTQLRGAIQDNLAHTIADQASEDVKAVASGAMAPEEQITARIAAWRQQLEAERDRFLQARTGSQGGAGGPAGAGTTPPVGAGGTGLPPAGGLPGGAGATGLPENAPTFDEAARQRLADATAATKQRSATFGNGPVGQVLRKAGDANTFRLQDAGVPAKFFRPGPTGYEDAQSLVRAVGPDQAHALLADAAAASLRRAAINEDGVVDVGRFATWYAKHQGALRALPQAVRDQFADAVRAGQAVAEATQVRAQQLKDFQSGKTAQLLGAQSANDVSRVVGQVFASPRPAAMMEGLVRAVANDTDAKAGLRQAVADHIASKFISNTEVGTSGQGGIKADAFQSFVRNNREGLAKVFNPAELDTLSAIAEDIRQSLRSRDAVRIPGQSNTAQDVYAVNKQTSVLGKVIRNTIGAGVGSLLGPIGTVAGYFGARELTALRDAGIQSVDALVTRAMLDPALARRLLERAPEGAPIPVSRGEALSRAIRRSLYATVPITANAMRGQQ